MKRSLCRLPIAAVVLLATAVVIVRPPEPCGPGPAEVEPLGLTLEAVSPYPRADAGLRWPGAWNGTRYRYRVNATGALVEVEAAGFWSAAQARQAAGRLAGWTAIAPTQAGAVTWTWGPDAAGVRVLTVRGRLLCDFHLWRGEAPLTASDVAALEALLALSFGAACRPAPIRLDLPGVPAAAGGAACDYSQEEREPGAFSLSIQGRPPLVFSWRDGLWPESVPIYPGGEVEARLGAEVSPELWSSLALGLGDDDPWRGPLPLAVFDDRGEARFILPPGLASGEYCLVLADRTFGVNSGIGAVRLEVAAVPYPEVAVSPAGLDSLLGGAQRVVLAARDLPGVYRDIAGGLLAEFRAAAGALGSVVAGAGLPVYPDYALYVYTGEPSRVRPVVIGLAGPEHVLVTPGDVCLNGAANLWQSVQGALDLPCPERGDAYALLRATRVEVLFTGDERPKVFDLAGGQENAGTVAGLARAVRSGVLNNLCEPAGEPAVVLVFTAMGAKIEVRVFAGAGCGPGQAAVIGPADGIYWREGLVDLIRSLTGG